MKNYLTAVLAASIVLGIASALPADEKLYHLSKVPKFRVGDKAISQKMEVSDYSITTSGGKVVNREKTRKETHIVYEVTKVDETGRIQAFRVSIISAGKQFDIEVPQRDGKKIAIDKIHFLARHNGLKFDADTTTVVSEKSVSLKASHVWLLKGHCKDGISFPMYPEDDALLFPREPVRVGHTWKPTRKTLDKWAEAGCAARDLEGKAFSAEFLFVSVTGAVALIEGKIVLEADLEGKRVKLTARLTAKIDTRSGRWVGGASYGTIAAKRRDITMKMVGREEEKAAFKSGDGKVSLLAGKLFKIGWKRPGKDTNNYTDKVNGFSLNIPVGYTAQKVDPEGRFKAQFADKRGMVIVVLSDRNDYPVDIDDVMKNFQTDMRRTGSMPDYVISKKEKVTLAGNVPGILVTGKAFIGLIAVQTVVAIDGMRVLSASAGVPRGEKDMRNKLKKTLLAFRLFKPSITK